MPGGTLDPAPSPHAFVYGTLTLFGLPSHAVLLTLSSVLAVLNPTGIATHGLASSPFARRYSENLV